MKTTRLSKNFAALCLAMAGFWAAQGALAEVVVPEWQNSFDGNAPANNVAFYLYHVDSDKFATNQTELVSGEKATPWKNDDKFYNLKDGTKYYWRVEDAEFNNKKDQDVKYRKEDNGDKWCLYFQYSASVSGSWLPKTVYPVLFANNGQLDITYRPTSLVPAYEWYLISESQWKNHIAIADAKILLDEANSLLESAIEGEPQQALQTAVGNTENVIEAIINIDEDASGAINEKVDVLKQALKDYKDANAGQMLEVLGNAISAAREFSPMFTFLDTAINEADAVYTKEGATPDELDAATKKLAGCVEQAQTIKDSEEYTAYLAYIPQIKANIAKAAEAGYTGYDAAGFNSAIATAEAALLGLSSKDGFSKEEPKINDKLKAAVDKSEGDVARYAGAVAVAAQAAKVGYTADVASLKAARVVDLPGLITNIRTAATAEARINDFLADYEGGDPIDMTIFIANNSFELGDQTGWTVTDTDGDTGVKLAATQNTVTENVDGGFLFNTWQNASTLVGGEYFRGYGIYQKLSGLPNGKYRLEALLTSAHDNKTFLTVNDNDISTLRPQARVGEGVSSANDESEFVNASYEFNVTDGTVTIGAIGESRQSSLVNYNTWFRADNFRLSLISVKTVELEDKAETYAYEEGTIRRVKVSRTIQPGQWTTLCLPMECAIPQYVTLYEVKDEAQDGEHVSIVVEASSDNTIKKGKPYIVYYPATHKETQWFQQVDQPNPTITEFTATIVELAEAPIPEGNYIPFTGIFSATELNPGDIYVSTSIDASAEAPVYKELSETASNKTMKGFRAYFKVPEGANSNVRFITDDVITSIMQAIEEQQKANGTYDLSGRKANTLQKGTYIIDGKKVIIK